MQKLIWIENNPIFCKESGAIDIENNPYMKLCFFECCRTCNGQYHNCVQKSTPARQTCLKTDYECASECSKKSALNITIKGWWWIKQKTKDSSVTDGLRTFQSTCDVMVNCQGWLSWPNNLVEMKLSEKTILKLEVYFGLSFVSKRRFLSS